MQRKIKMINKCDYIYEIISFWLSDENYQYYMLSLIDSLKDDINDPVVFKDGSKRRNYKLEKKTIAEIVLEKFSYACKEELINQNGSRNPKEYYYEIFNKIYNNPYYKHKDEDKLQEMIRELKTFVQEGHFKLDRKASVNKVIDDLTKEKTLEEKPLVEVSDKDLAVHSRYFKESLKESLQDNSRMDFTKDNVLIFGDENEDLKSYAYSFDYAKDGSVLLRFHVLDIQSIVANDTPIYFDMKNNNRLNEKLVKQASFKVGQEVPTITYQLNIDSKGRIYNFKFYKSKISPTKAIDKKTSYEMLKKDFSLKPYVYVYRILKANYKLDENCNNLQKIDQFFVNILNNVVSETVSKNDLPAIFKVQEKPDPEEFANQIINLNWSMYRLKDNEFENVYRIICDKANTKAHFSLNNIGHYGEKRKSVLSITKPFSFVGLKLQQVLMDFSSKGLSKASLSDEYQEELLEALNYYNKKFYGITTKEESKIKNKNVRVKK